MNNRHTAKRIAVYSPLLAATLATFMLPLEPQRSIAMLPPSDVMNLTGIVHDFSVTHPDFGITNVVDMGHHVGTVVTTLSADRRPVSTGGGLQVATQWTDQNGNPIAPYATDPGLPGGHFDVDVYDAPTTSEVEHEHEYDDTHNAAYFDVINDTVDLNPASRYDAIIGPGYPNQLRMVFNNVHNGGAGTYRFDAGAGLVQGNTAAGFTAIFDPALLVELRVDFVSLSALAATDPGDSQADPINRNDAFSIRMYDMVTNVMVYEVAVYHHDQGVAVSDVIGSGIVMTGLNDACGNPINDIAGNFGVAGTAAITDSTSFEQWFRDVLGVNQSIAYTISLQRDAYGVYEYATASFFPIDGILLGNESDPHNNLFTYMLSASFTYSSCTGQFFEFESNDDAWAFVDSKLVIDLGGTLTPERQYVDLDRLGLVDGQTYTIDFFFAHRRVSLDSLFHMRTNIQLVTGTMPAVTAFYD